MKRTTGIVLVLFLGFAGYSVKLAGQERVQEKVEVRWWVVPLFALDSKNKPCLDLQPQDLELRVQGRKIADFTLHKSDVMTDEQSRAALPPEQQRKNVIFLLFDTALTGPKHIEKSKKIAARVVAESPASSYFVVLKIDPFNGLETLVGATSDKTVVQQCIRTGIVATTQSKPFTGWDIYYELAAISDSGETRRGGGRLDAEDIEIIAKQLAGIQRPKTQIFFDSFRTLQRLMAGIQDNRVLYFFSEGVSNITAHYMFEGQSTLLQYVEETAGYLNQCGGVLFIVNTSGVEKVDSVNSSGENALRQMAAMSGGKYLEGQEKKIAETISNSQRAYYEIAFPAPLEKNDSSIVVEIKPRRSSLQIISLKSAYRKKRIEEMNAMEQGLFVMECLRGNPLLKETYDILAASTERGEPTPEGEKIKMHLPFDPRGKKMILYQVGFSREDEPLSMSIHPMVSSSPHLLLDLKKKKVERIIYWRQILLIIDKNLVLINPMKIEAL